MMVYLDVGLASSSVQALLGNGKILIFRVLQDRQTVDHIINSSTIFNFFALLHEEGQVRDSVHVRSHTEVVIVYCTGVIQCLWPRNFAFDTGAILASWRFDA